MNYSTYPLIAGNNAFVYTFFSEGPKGKIKKAVFFTRIDTNLFNLGFGDWNEELQDIDDASRSNNGDRDKVLATVAYCAVIFTDQFPKAKLLMVGSTPARTRLYQMGIAYNLPEVNKTFEILGLINDGWSNFETGRNYQAFLITRK